uniref:ADP,ATP carrier protein n=1 Tax=Solibacter usitatus (strain Ellin6076) TaxID=234267 RepID=Q028W6_SOLUE
MRTIRLFWRGVYDVRPGEGVRTLFMALHMTCVLFAYYILKPLSQALFLSKFDIDQLPILYVLIAIVGGVLAYAYTRVAVRVSLASAVNWATGSTLVCLLAIWWMLRFNFDWMLYVFNIWVSLFSIVTVSQGWLIAANIFTSREAKRLYGLLGLSAVAGAAFGGTFTAQLARMVESRDLLLATAVMVVLGYVCFRVVAAQKNVNLSKAHGSESDEEFAFKDIVAGIRGHRHLQVIMAIITITFIVDLMVQFQFSAMAKAAFSDKKELTAFLGSFYGLYLNLITFAMQFFLTAMIVRFFGVGGTLQVMPVLIAIAAAITAFVPHLTAAAAMRLSEAATRYSFNRTGTELLYVPLPTELKNRTKAFVDIFMDRFGRGLGALFLMAYTALFESDPKHPNMTRLSIVIGGIAILWFLLSARAGKEYLNTVRRRLESRRLDLDGARITVAGSETVSLLEKTIAEGTPRQASYALSLLADVPGYDVGPHVEALARHAADECRSGAYEIAAKVRYAGLVEVAAQVLEPGAPGGTRTRQAALAYILTVAPEGPVNDEWIRWAAAAPDPARRALAANAIGLRAGTHSQEDGAALRRLLDDPDPLVASEACRAAGQVGDRIYFEQIARRLADHAVRGRAIESLAMYGARVSGSLGDTLLDSHTPLVVRRQIPRVLRLIRDQRSVDVLAGSLGAPDLPLRLAVVKALNRLRESAPELLMPKPAIQQQIQAEARYCFELHALLAPLRTAMQPATASSLLVRTVDHRVRQTMERIFRLLGLLYPPNEIYNAYVALESGVADRVSPAHDYLDSLLTREIKHILMPLLDSRDRLLIHARDLCHIAPKSVESALRDLLASGDSWLTMCAIAAAAELKLKGLSAEIAKAGESAGQETVAVAKAAAAALA